MELELRKQQTFLNKLNRLKLNEEETVFSDTDEQQQLATNYQVRSWDLSGPPVGQVLLVVIWSSAAVCPSSMTRNETPVNAEREELR